MFLKGCSVGLQFPPLSMELKVIQLNWPEIRDWKKKVLLNSVYKYNSFMELAVTRCGNSLDAC